MRHSAGSFRYGAAFTESLGVAGWRGWEERDACGRVPGRQGRTGGSGGGRGDDLAPSFADGDQGTIRLVKIGVREAAFTRATCALNSALGTSSPIEVSEIAPINQDLGTWYLTKTDLKLL
jgi:hypothetical protein